jgi:phage FluMu protein Com
MDALDGNAIAGALMEHFGHEMTMAQVRCSHCQTTMMIAELRVYMKAPGDVARCPTCDQVVMVIVNAHGQQHLHTPNMEMVSPT